MEEKHYHITFESGHTKLVDGEWQRGDTQWMYFKKKDGNMVYFNIDRVECVKEYIKE